MLCALSHMVEVRVGEGGRGRKEGWGNDQESTRRIYAPNVSAVSFGFGDYLLSPTRISRSLRVCL